MTFAAADGSGAEAVLPEGVGQGFHPDWSPDGATVLFTQFVLGVADPPRASSLEVLDLKTGTLTQVVKASSPRLVDVGRWSPDGKQIVYSVETVQSAADKPDWADTWDLWTIAPDGSGPKKLTAVDAGVHVWQPSWAPDGTAIYATQDSPTGREAVRVELDETIGVGLTGATHVRLQPTA